TDYDSLTVPADTQRFTYDVGGLMRSAENRGALIRRSYYPTGQLKTDSLWIRPYSGGSGQIYALAYAYDLNGRRTSLTYPSLLGSSAEYMYTGWGALKAVRGLAGEWYSFGYDYEGRPEFVVYPQATGLTERFTYDS